MDIASIIKRGKDLIEKGKTAQEARGILQKELDLTDEVAEKVYYQLSNAKPYEPRSDKVARGQAKYGSKDNAGDGWVRGKLGDFLYEAKVYDEGSDYGINSGRVWNLEVRDKNGKVVVNYDRGWDVGEDKKSIWQPIIDKYE